MGQVGQTHRTVPLVLHGLRVLVGQVGFHRTIPLVLFGTGGHIGLRVLVGQVGFHRTVPLVLHGTSGMGRTHRIEGVGGTGRIP